MNFAREVVGDGSAFYECALLHADDLREKRGESVSEDFLAYFVL